MGVNAAHSMNWIVNSGHIMNEVVNSVHAIRGGLADLTFIFQSYLIVYGVIAPLIFRIIRCVDISFCVIGYN